MAQSVIGALRVNLGLDSAQFERGAKRSQTTAQKLAKELRRAATVGAAAFAAIGAAAIAGANDIDRLAKAGRRIDTTVGGMRALELAAGEAGVQVGSLTDAVQNIDRDIAAGTAGAARSLETLGLAAADIAGLEADQKLALIADRVKGLGLSSGETSALLRDLGVRNRDMILLLGQGGDALRKARQDVDDYGLSLSRVDAGAIETANDQIGRLSLVARALGQALALAVVPAMGRFSEAITDSLRAGGALRGVIEGISGAARGLAIITETVVNGIGNLVDMVGINAVGAVAGLSAALVILRRRMIMTGIGALIVGAGALVDFLDRLKGATGSWGEALRAVGEVGKAVFLGVGNTAWGLLDIMAGVASALSGHFMRAFSEIAKAWDRLVNGMATAWNAIAETRFGEVLGLNAMGQSNISGAMGEFADALFDQAESSIIQGGQRIRDAGQGVTDAVQNLRDILSQDDGSTTDAADAARVLADELDEVASSGGRAASAIRGVTTETDDATRAAERYGSMASGALADVLLNTQSAKDAFKGLAEQLSRMAMDTAIQGLLGGIVGTKTGGDLFGGLAKVFGGGVASFAGGGYTGNGPRTGGLDGIGGRLAVLHPQETVIDHTRGGQSEPVQVVVRVLPSGEFDARVQNTARAVVRVEGPRQIGAALSRARETRALG